MTDLETDSNDSALAVLRNMAPEHGPVRFAPSSAHWNYEGSSVEIRVTGVTPREHGFEALLEASIELPISVLHCDSALLATTLNQVNRLHLALGQVLADTQTGQVAVVGRAGVGGWITVNTNRADAMLKAMAIAAPVVTDVLAKEVGARAHENGSADHCAWSSVERTRSDLPALQSFFSGFAMEELLRWKTPPWLFATGDESGLSAQVQFAAQPTRDAGLSSLLGSTSLLTVAPDAERPAWGSGVRVEISFPFPVDPTRGPLAAQELARRSMAERPFREEPGAWGWDHSTQAVCYGAFIPGPYVSADLMQWCSAEVAARSTWAAEQLPSVT